MRNPSRGCVSSFSTAVALQRWSCHFPTYGPRAGAYYASKNFYSVLILPLLPGPPTGISCSPAQLALALWLSTCITASTSATAYTQFSLKSLDCCAATFSFPLLLFLFYLSTTLPGLSARCPSLEPCCATPALSPRQASLPATSFFTIPSGPVTALLNARSIWTRNPSWKFTFPEGTLTFRPDARYSQSTPDLVFTSSSISELVTRREIENGHGISRLCIVLDVPKPRVRSAGGTPIGRSVRAIR